MKKIIGIITVLIITSCSRKEYLVDFEKTFLLQSAEHTVFENNFSRKFTTEYQYDNSGFLKAITRDKTHITFEKNEENAGSTTSPYIVSIENTPQLKITTEFFCDKNSRVIKEISSEGIEKSYSYDELGYLSMIIVNNGNGVPKDSIMYTYNSPSITTSLIKDIIVTSFHIQNGTDYWHLMKQSSINYYNPTEDKVKGEVSFPFNFGKEREKQLYKVVNMPLVEGEIEEKYFSYSFNENGYIKEKRTSVSGKLTEIIQYNYISHSK